MAIPIFDAEMLILNLGLKGEKGLQGDLGIAVERIFICNTDFLYRW